MDGVRILSRPYILPPENPRVGGSTLPLTTIHTHKILPLDGAVRSLS
jgi:hypothetical protein